MLNKFTMPRSQNVKFVENNLSRFLYESMRLARYDVDEEFCHNEQETESAEGKALNNFRRAYRFLLTTPHLEASYAYLLDLHWILMDGLMDLINNELTEQQVDYLYEMINQPAKANTEIAIDVMLYILDKRLFVDGDVRVAVMFANKIMVENGCGFISIPPERNQEFRAFLKAEKTPETVASFKKWVVTYCIRGIKNDY